MPDDGAPVFADDAIVPCKDAEDLAAARKALDTVSSSITVLGDGTSKEMTAAIDELKALLGTKCFELAAADLADPLEFDSGMSLKHWWYEGRGSQSIYQYLNPMTYSVTTAEQPRPALLLEGHEQSPLAPLLCKRDDANCGRATTGWVRRADWQLSHPDTTPPEKDPCVQQIAEATPEERWSVFRGCRDSMVQRYAVLPLGHFKAPTDGLFVRVSPGGRCRNITIYDLATGARMSSGLCALRNGQLSVEIGRVPVASLREAVWMTMIAGAAKNDYRPSADAVIPAGVVPGRPRDEGTGESIGLGSYGTSSRRTMWSWFRKNAQGRYVGQVSGEQYRGPSYEAAAHAAELLDLADEGFEDTCAPPLPVDAIRALEWSRPGPTAYESDSDIAGTMGHPDVQVLQAAVIAAKSPPKCTTAL